MNTNPYPGVSYHGLSKSNPWRAQINRRELHWRKNYPTPEAARDAYEAKLQEFELSRRTVDAVSRDKTNEMTELIDFEDRLEKVA